MSDLTPVGLPAPGAPAPGSPAAKLLAAARDLESVFYGQLFKAMRATVPEGGITQANVGEQVFTGMLDDKIASLATRQTDRGLATAIYHELSRRLHPQAKAPVAGAAASPESSNAAAR